MKNRTAARLRDWGLSTALAAVFVSGALRHAAAQGTAFTYEGHLSDAGSPAMGTYDIRAGLYVASTGGTVFAGPITNSGVAVSNGLFTITLDYGDVFDGTAYWLQVAVRSNTVGAFTILSPRQQLTPTPYAIFAESANAAGLSGTIPSASLAGAYSGVVNFTNPANIFVGSGSGLSGVNAATVGGLASSDFWATSGNAGTTPTNGNFVGTTDNQPLELRVNGSRALRLEPIANASNISNMVNVVCGSPANWVTPGSVGATIAGGGSSLYIVPGALANSVRGDFGTIGGGAANTATATGGTVAGGRGNFAGGFTFPTVGGGESNNASGPYAVVGGGFNNTASGGGLLGGSPTVAGGSGNLASGAYTTVGGGAGNIAAGDYATVGGGLYNSASNTDATVGGGTNNAADGAYATVAGGQNNLVSADNGTIGGGNGNTAAGNYSTVGGGHGNYANFSSATVAGGNANYAVASSATVCGGNANRASGNESMVLGGYGNTAEGTRSLAAGAYAWAEYGGSFVWADNSSTHQFISTAANVFFARCTGGVKFTTATDSFGADAAGVKVAAGGTSWTTVCDRNAKKNFQPVDAMAVLNKLAAIPIEQWNYKWEADTDTPNVGPMAQDFKTAFYPGRDDKSISTLEFDGVELAAIQGLNQKLDEQLKSKDEEIRELKQQNKLLTKRLNRLEAAVEEYARFPDTFSNETTH